MAELERAAQAIQLLPPDLLRQVLLAQDSGGDSAPRSQRYSEEKIAPFLEDLILPYVPDDLRAKIDAVEWSDLSRDLFSEACRSLQLRSPDVDPAHLRQLVHGMWFEERLDTRSVPLPASTSEQLRKRPELAAVDKSLRDIQDGPLRDLLRVALHLGVRSAQPDPAFEDIDGNEAALKDLLASVHKTKALACNMTTLAFSLLSELTSSRRSIMWELMGVKKHELTGRSLFTADDRALFGKIVEQRQWEEAALPRPSRPAHRGRPGGRGGRGGRGGTSGSAPKASEERHQLSDAPPSAAGSAQRPSTPAASSKAGTPSKSTRGSGKPRGRK